MKRHLFLSGSAFSGKSRMLRDALGEERLRMAGGFGTKLSAAPEGGLLGCSLLPIAAFGGLEGFEEELFLDLSSMPPGHDSEVFRETGTRLLEEAGFYPFAVLDEVGGIDLIIPQFREALDRLLASPLPLLGVVKTREESGHLRELLGLGERFTAFSDRLHRLLETDADTQVLMIEEDRQTEAEETLRAWIREYAPRVGF